MAANQPKQRPASPRKHGRAGNVPSNQSSPESKEYGEGNYKASREFDSAETEFVRSGKVEDAAREAAPKSDAEREELLAAEEKARRRAKEEDPALLKKQK